MGEKKNVYGVLVGKPEEKRSLGRPGCRWEDIKLYLKETRWEGVDCIYLAHDRAKQHIVMNVQMS
jgi:hypothetical protein